MGGSMDGPSFHELKKQASFFLKEKIKTARLVLTDVTPTQLLAEEATNGDPGGPDAATLKSISRAAFEVDDYCRIVEILHKRLARFDRRNWRPSYKALVVVEHMLTHGPERVADEFQCDRRTIIEMESFQHVDEKGFNWGLTVRKKSERVLKLLEKGPVLKEERDRARKISREIQGFGNGSFSIRTSGQGTLQQSSSSSQRALDRCNSDFTTDHTNQGDEFFQVPNENNIMIKTNIEKPMFHTSSKPVDFSPGNSGTHVESKENRVPNDVHVVDSPREMKPLLSEQVGESRINVFPGSYHPFEETEHIASKLLLSTADKQRTH